MKINKLFLKILFIFLAFRFFSQNVQWVNSYSVSNCADGTADAKGNAYITGYYNGSSIIGTYSINTNGNEDIYIAKVNSSGTVKWVKSFGGSATDNGRCVSSNSSNIFLAGEFLSPSLVVGSNTLSTSSIGLFLCKMDTLGNIIWVTQYANSSSSSVYVNSICTDAAGNSYCAGNFIGTCVIGTSTLTAPGMGFEGYVTKLDINGNVIWCKTIGGSTNTENINGITTDNAGNAYITGYFNFGSTTTVGNYTLSSSGSTDAFAAKLSPAGNVLWAKRFGGSGADLGRSITSNNGPFLYIGGNYNPPFTMGSNTFTQAGIYISRLDTSGTIIWANNFEKNPVGSQNINLNKILTDVGGNVYSTGWFTGTTTFGSSTVSAVALSAPSSDANADGFISKLDASGAFSWVKQITSSINSLQYGKSLAYTSGMIYCLGDAFSSSSIDTFTFNTSSGEFGFLLKMAANDVGIEENIKELSVFVYPNPANDKLFIELTENTEELYYSLTDVTGKKVIHKKRIVSKESINVSHYSKGIYFLQLEAKNQIAVKKIIIE